MTTKIKQDKSIKTCGNYALILFSNSSKMDLNIKYISSKCLLQLSEKSFRRPKIPKIYPHFLHFYIAKHALVELWSWCWSLTLDLLSWWKYREHQLIHVENMSLKVEIFQTTVIFSNILLYCPWKFLYLLGNRVQKDIFSCCKSKQEYSITKLLSTSSEKREQNEILKPSWRQIYAQMLLKP